MPITVPMEVPANLLSAVNRLLILAEQEPLVADTLVPILSNALDFALTSGNPKDPTVWIRAFEAAGFEVANKKAAKLWLNSEVLKTE